MKKKENNSACFSHEAGLRSVTVAMFIVLLAFFIVLNAIAVDDDRNTLEALGSLTGSFGILPGGLCAIEEGNVRVISSDQVPMDRREKETVEIVGEEKSDERLVDMQDIPQGETIRIRDTVLFNEGGYKIRPGAYEFLKRISYTINTGEFPVEITVHTDDLPDEEKSYINNREISSLRALEVFKFLVILGNVLPSRVISYGCGEYKAIASNETRESRLRNRRIDIVLVRNSTGNLNGIYQKDPTALVVFKRFVFRIFN